MKTSYYIQNSATGKFYSSFHNSGFVKNHIDADSWTSFKRAQKQILQIRRDHPKTDFVIVAAKFEFIPVRGF